MFAGESLSRGAGPEGANDDVFLEFVEVVEDAAHPGGIRKIAFSPVALPEGIGRNAAVIENGEFDFDIAPESPVPVDDAGNVSLRVNEYVLAPDIHVKEGRGNVPVEEAEACVESRDGGAGFGGVEEPTGADIFNEQGPHGAEGIGPGAARGHGAVLTEVTIGAGAAVAVEGGKMRAGFVEGAGDGGWREERVGKGRARKEGHDDEVSIDERPGVVAHEDIGDGDGRVTVDDVVDGGFLNHHAAFVEEEARVVGRGDADDGADAGGKGDEPAFVKLTGGDTFEGDGIPAMCGIKGLDERRSDHRPKPRRQPPPMAEGHSKSSSEREVETVSPGSRKRSLPASRSPERPETRQLAGSRPMTYSPGPIIFHWTSSERTPLE